MSNIYDRNLDFKIKPDGKRILERPTSTSYPRYAVEGNTKPNLDFKTNRMLQPIFSSKIPIQQNPFVLKQPVHAFGLGGRYPIDIDYVSVPTTPRKPYGLIWEPNSIREMRQNVYPDGLRKNNLPTQLQDSQYLEYLNNEKKRADLEKIYDERGGNGLRPHPTREEELKKLENLIAETKYGKGPYKNIALNAEDHAKLAQQSADDIRKELDALRKESKENRGELVGAILQSAYLSDPVVKKEGEDVDEKLTSGFSKLDPSKKDDMEKIQQLGKDDDSTIKELEKLYGPKGKLKRGAPIFITDFDSYRKYVISRNINEQYPGLDPEDFAAVFEIVTSDVGSKVKNYNSIRDKIKKSFTDKIDKMYPPKK